VLASVAGDLHVTEVVDRNKGGHMALPRSVFSH
jgi:acetamidase/formamidase